MTVAGNRCNTRHFAESHLGMICEQNRKARHRALESLPHYASSQRYRSGIIMRPFALACCCVLLSLYCSLVIAGTTPPFPSSSNFGVSSSLIWSFGSFSNAGDNPLNNPTATTSGSGGDPNSCSIANIQTEYHFNMYENYQQLITFFPSACTNLRVRITAVPGSVLHATQLAIASHCLLNTDFSMFLAPLQCFYRHSVSLLPRERSYGYCVGEHRSAIEYGTLSTG